MTTPVHQHRSESLRPSRASPAQQIPAQHRSSFGEGSVSAPPIHDAGRPLDTTTRGAMEAGFGRDFSDIRVHDDARAHDAARGLSARAYAAGNHIVFGEGNYRPESTSGRALIAHELAHSVQQSGVQMKAEGTLPASSDAELEAQADRAAVAVTSGGRVPTLSRIGRPVVFRQTNTTPTGNPPAAPSATTPQAGPSADLAKDPTTQQPIKIDAEVPEGPGATYVALTLPMLTLPKPKGAGDWVEKTYKAVAQGGSLIFQPTFKGNKVQSAIKEEPGTKYRDLWINNYGFASLKDMAKAFDTAATADPAIKAITDRSDVKKILNGFKIDNLTSAGCDIDHIVEKQIGGGSIPSNLQLLLSSKNRSAGTETFKQLTAQVNAICQPARPKVTQFTLKFSDAKFATTDTADASFEIETLLRSKDKKIFGKDEVRKAGEGVLVGLLAGGKQEVTRVRATGPTDIETGAGRLVSGLKLLRYVRATGKKGSTEDTVEAVLASKPLHPLGTKPIVLTAAPATAPTSADTGAAGLAAADRAAASEHRELKLDKAKNKDVAAYFPYLSPVKFSSLELDPQGKLNGEAKISPSIKFLGELKVKMAPDKLDLLQDINETALNSSAFMKPLVSLFRFKAGSKISIDLVDFKPDGNLEFEVGPSSKPVILGSAKATVAGGAFVASGDLKPAGKVPGIDSAAGSVTYRSDTGWSGELSVTKSSIPNTTGSAKLGFREKDGKIVPYGEGKLSTTIRGASLATSLSWSGTTLSYKIRGKIQNPLPLVKEVTIDDSGYTDETLVVTGWADIEWKSIAAKLKITYRQKGSEDGKFSGNATVKFPNPPDPTKKASGYIDLSFDEEGKYRGKGEVTYQVTKDIRPKLGLQLENGKLKASGTVALGDIALTRKWPSEQGASLTLIKGLEAKFRIPVPSVPIVSIFGSLSVSAGLGYYAGPVKVTGVTFNGSLYPLEPDPQISATLTGRLSVPASASIFGSFGADIGAEVAGGLVSASGGVRVRPKLELSGEGALDVNVGYTSGGFSFEAVAFARAQLTLEMNVDLVATLSGAWGLASYTWNYPAYYDKRPIGPELKLTLGKVAYKDGQVHWPNTSDIKLEPARIDPIGILKDLVSSKSAKKKE